MEEVMGEYSVLMSVYAKEKPEFLRESMMSMYEQTVPTDDFVLVCDGPLNDELDKVIDEMQEKFGKVLHVVRLSENRGLGYALNAGVKECKNELIARMDSDDVAVKDRCERELKIFEEKPEMVIVGGYVGEFENEPENIKTIRKVPEDTKQMLGFVKKRNPLNHPTVMFKKQEVIDAGNYQNVRFCQDYFLWVELLSKGCECYNIQDVIVYMREDEGTFRRRSGKKYYEIQKKLAKKMREKKMMSTLEYQKYVTVRLCSAFAPNWMRQALFVKFMREGARE